MPRYVLKSEAGKGWRIWNTKMRQWWGVWFTTQPDELVAELKKT